MTENSCPVGKYYTWSRRRPINLQADGCDFGQWNHPPVNALFARHSEGFLVFLPPDKLDSSDEYRESDPYSAAQKSSFHGRRTECTLELVKQAVETTGAAAKILDLGCGEGHITQAIHSAWPEAEISALDYSISAIRYANKYYSGIDFIVGNAYDPPYTQGYFDIVVCNNLWEHVPDPLVLLSKISTVLRSNGFLIISTPSRYRWGNLTRILRGKPVELASEHHVTEYSVGQVIEQLRYGGFGTRKVYSKPLGRESLKMRIAQKLLLVFVSVTGSHHQLESTVFYLAQRNSA